MALRIFNREAAAKEAELNRLAKLKEKATGSPTLGGEDRRLTAGKWLSAALALGVAAGVAKGVIERHHAQIEKEKAVAAAIERGREGERMRALRKAGAPTSMAWTDALRANKAVANYFGGSVRPLTPDDLRIIQQIVSRGQSHTPFGINLVMAALKAVNPYAKTPEDFEHERRNIRNAVTFLTTDWDWPIASEASSLAGYIEDNNHKPEFRKLLLKLRAYAVMNAYPFDPAPARPEKDRV